MKSKLKAAVIIFFVIIIIILCFGFIDYLRVKSFEKPIFCIGTNLKKDGGSGLYMGIFYSFNIEGNFMPEDELKGVTYYDYYIFGIRVLSCERD